MGIQVCEQCNNTGSLQAGGNLDCTAPNCHSAEERTALNRFISAMTKGLNMAPEDVYWLVHQRAVAMVKETD